MTDMGTNSEAEFDESSSSVPLPWRGYCESDFAILRHDLGLRASIGRCRLECLLSTALLRT